VVEGLDSVPESLFLYFPHGVFGITDFDGDFPVFEFVEVNLPDDFAVVFVSVGSGIDDFGGVP
jgi:hypothetical protein